jgi:Zn-dependent peptidase ImmA (M78 family)
MSRPTPAEKLLLELGIEEPGDIDLEAIAADQGVFVKYRPLDGCEARIVGDQRHAIVSVNSGSRPTRQRFSLAHELGHWHHHRGKYLFCGPDQIGNPARGPLDPERQADEFASDLIFPDFMFRPAISKLGRVLLSDVREIADRFQASLTATLLKTAKSGRFPIVVVRDGKTGPRWSVRSPLLPTWWKLQRDLAPETIAYGLLQDGAPEEKWPRLIGADAWFEFKGCDRYEAKEQSFATGPDEIITVLTIPPEGLG